MNRPLKIKRKKCPNAGDDGCWEKCYEWQAMCDGCRRLHEQEYTRERNDLLRSWELKEEEED